MLQQGEYARFTILVVEDDPAIRELVVTRLNIAGYQAWEARNGAEALEMVRSQKPSAMILDLNMPEADGFEVLSKLQLDPVTAKLPVLVLTARNATEDVRRVIELGARDYLTKPFNDQQLLSRVARLLRKRRTRPNEVVAESGDDVVLL